jgi:ATP-dependent DNA helicase RecG
MDIPEAENQYIEFKRETVTAWDIVQGVVAFANAEGTASREELIRLFQASGLFHYDLIELESVSEINLNYSEIADYFTRYQIHFTEESESEKRRLIQASDIIGKQGHPSVGGLLIFGITPERFMPSAGIAFAHFLGREMNAELLDKKFFGGSLPRQVDNALAAIKANIPVASTLQGAKRIESFHYSDKVFRELLVNACVHRNYSITGSQIRVLLFQDRLEFISPGRLPNTVTVEKLIVGTSFARNPLLVRFMENLGYMDRLGRGLPMVYREAKEHNKAIEFIDEGEEFRVIVEL